MTFDNSRTLYGIRIRIFTVTVIFLGYLILAYAAEKLRFPLLGMSETVWTLLMAGLWVFVTLMPMFMSYQFIFFSDDTDRIIIRYFNAGIVGGRKNSLEIDKRTFSGYKTETSLFGLITRLILFQKFSEGVAKYPPVYISALNRAEKDKLLKALNKYTQK